MQLEGAVPLLIYISSIVSVKHFFFTTSEIITKGPVVHIVIIVELVICMANRANQGSNPDVFKWFVSPYLPSFGRSPRTRRTHSPFRLSFLDTWHTHFTFPNSTSQKYTPYRPTTILSSCCIQTGPIFPHPTPNSATTLLGFLVRIMTPKVLTSYSHSGPSPSYDPM